MTFNASDEYRPSWSHDGAWIYFSSTQGGRSEIWRMPFGSSGPARQITTTGAFEGREGPDGETLYYMKVIHGALFERAVAGGAERQIIDAVFRANFDVTGAGIYYITRPDAVNQPYQFELRVLGQAASNPTVLNRFEALEVLGVSVSPDRQTVLSSGARTTAGDDIWLIRNFR
jgi:WD40-like Beta Propeller Repeat